MKQRAYCKAFHVVCFGIKMLFYHGVKNADGMHYKPVFAGAMIPRACGRGEKIGAFNPFQKLIRAAALDVSFIYLDEFFFFGHAVTSLLSDKKL